MTTQAETGVMHLKANDTKDARKRKKPGGGREDSARTSLRGRKSPIDPLAMDFSSPEPRDNTLLLL